MAESISEKAKEEKLKGIADLYGKTTNAWEDMLEEHIHHGYYEPGSVPSKSDNLAAQVRMIDEVLRFASIPDDPENKPKRILDVGCGIGGTCRYLARKYGAQCKGISISPMEVQKAQALAAAQGLHEEVSFEVADALDLPFPGGQFDLVWCMETAEYVPPSEKEKVLNFDAFSTIAKPLVREMVRVAAPGATIVLTSWCHRDLSSSEQSLKPDEDKFMKKMCGLVLLPPFCSVYDYVSCFKSHQLEDIKTDDWTQYATPFDIAMVASASSIKGFFSILWTGGWDALKFIRASNMMIKAQKNGLVKLLVLSSQKPK